MCAAKRPAGLSITVNEHEHTILNSDNSIARFDPRGKVVVRNNSRQFAIWDAELEPNRPNRSTFGDDTLDIGRLEPMSEWEKEFMVKEIESPMLLLTEVVDTFYERVGVNTALVFEYKMPMEFSISLRNHSGATIRDIVVTKIIPLIFKDIKVQKTEIGKVKHETKAGQIVWSIKELPPDQIAVQRIRATIIAEDTEPKSAGKVHVSYKIPEVVRSTLLPTLHGSSETLVSVEKEDHPHRAGTWRCKAALTNSSEFPIRLNRVQIVQIAPDNDLLYEGTPNLRLESGEVWGHEFEVSAEKPEFDVIALSTVEAPVDQEIRGTIEKEENTFPVLRIEGTKQVEPLELLAWEPTPIAVSLQVKNTGTNECEEILFNDTIPAGFEPPDKMQIRVRIGDRPLTRSVDLKIRPSDPDLKIQRTLSIHLRDLKESHATLKPGDIVSANYIMIARTPKPTYEYALPLTVKANTFPPGPEAKFQIPESLAPKIQVRSVVRKLRKTRTVSPGTEPGELIVTVTFVNESETSLYDPELQDLIPPNFDFVGVPTGNPEPTSSETMNGVLLTWSLPTMMSQEKFVSKYIYRPKE